MQQVITFKPDGSVEGLQHKKGQGLDLRQFGRASIQRASEIIWEEDDQAWLVRPLSGPCAGNDLTYRMWSELLDPKKLEKLGGTAGQTVDHPVMFGDYEEAVKAEIAYLNAMRLKGKL